MPYCLCRLPPAYLNRHLPIRRHEEQPPETQPALPKTCTPAENMAGYLKILHERETMFQVAFSFAGRRCA
ncbi:hypothetical protein A7Q00_01115 [Eikenella halliae]|uniref:Uncharacterized protein n=1 Tax=Eikenella halliae TaxID=1795832 RepID=A0A1B6W1E9_9NEIS|nr:hypothetical protein A7Q00_01115 [Eikenella halliae]